MNARISALVVMVLLMLAGCAGQPAALTQSQIDEIQTIQIVNFVPQREINAKFSTTQMYPVYMGPGGFVAGALFGAAVGAANALGDHMGAKDAEEKAQFYRDELLHFDFPKALSGHLELSAQQIPWAQSRGVSDWVGVDELDVASLQPQNPRDTLLVVQSMYSIASDQTIVAIDAIATLFQIETKSDSPKVLLSNHYHVQSPVHRVPDGDEGLELVNAEQGAELIAEIKDKYQQKADAVEYNESRLQYLKKKRDGEIRDVEKRIVSSQYLVDISKQPWSSATLASALDAGAQQLARLISIDLSAQASASAEQSALEDIPATTVGSTMSSHTKLKGRNLGDSQGYTAYRMEAGHFYAAPQGQRLRLYGPER